MQGHSRGFLNLRDLGEILAFSDEYNYFTSSPSIDIENVADLCALRYLLFSVPGGGEGRNTWRVP